MDRVYALMATIPQREKALPKVIDSLYPQVDELRIVFNNYEKIPGWIKSKDKIQPLLNNPDKHTSNAIWLLMGGVSGYVFTCDDDILYPLDYVSKMSVKLSNKYNKRAVLTLYGEIVRWPARNYKCGRVSLGFQRKQPEDIVVDIGGVGCSLFHTNVLRPRMEDFPDIFSRDLWFAILAARNKLPIVSIESCRQWLHRCDLEGPKIKDIWRRDPKLSTRREEVFSNILVPLLRRNGRDLKKSQ